MRFFVFLTILVASFSVNVSYASQDSVDLDKIYIQPEDIHPTNFGIFIRYENEFYPVWGVFVDEGGLYVCPEL